MIVWKLTTPLGSPLMCGQLKEVMETVEELLAEDVYAGASMTFSVEAVEMTAEAFDALPEHGGW